MATQSRKTDFQIPELKKFSPAFLLKRIHGSVADFTLGSCFSPGGLWTRRFHAGIRPVSDYVAAPEGARLLREKFCLWGLGNPMACLFFPLRERECQFQYLSRETPQPAVPPCPLPPRPRLRSSGETITMESRRHLKRPSEHLCSSLLGWGFWGCCSEDIYKRNAHFLGYSERQLHSEDGESGPP